MELFITTTVRTSDPPEWLDDCRGMWEVYCWNGKHESLKGNVEGEIKPWNIFLWP
jgi:hypothetical protein